VPDKIPSITAIAPRSDKARGNESKKAAATRVWRNNTRVKGSAATANEFLAMVRDFFAMVRDFPAMVRELPTMVRGFPAVAKDFPTMAKELPATAKGLLTAVNDL
jgi:hypothetical protein